MGCDVKKTLNGEPGGAIGLPGGDLPVSGVKGAPGGITESPGISRRRILVTGGAGFIGSHLCRRLLGLGHEVLAADNFSSSARRNVHGLLGEPRFELIRHDVTFPLYVEVDQVYHLACPASPVHYQRDPVQTTKTCVVGSINMLGLAKRLGAPVLLASTSEVYGDPAVHPQSESYWGNVNPVGPRSCYDEGKRCAQTLFFDYHRQHGLKIKVARIFNTYGPRMVNIGNPDEFTMLELAKRVLALTGSSSPVEYCPLPADDPARRRPDITLAREVLGWSPSVPFSDGIAKTVHYFRRELAVR